MQKKRIYIIAAAVIAGLIGIYVGIEVYRKHRIEKLRLIDKEKRHRVLTDLHGFLMKFANETGTEPFLMYGTLLGQQRENNLICWDYDLDYGIHKDEYAKLREAIAKEIKSYPQYKLTSSAFEDLIGAKQLKIEDIETGLNLDVSSMVVEGTESVRRDYPRILLRYYFKEANTDFPYKAVFPLTPVSFLGVLSYIPAYPPAMLKSWYGEKYMTPDRTCACEACAKK